MSKYDYIQEFGGGGRISPQDSATAFPEGTLGKGINGGLWINQKDKNGRLSWKPTSITKDKFPDMDIYIYGKNIEIILFGILTIRYGYGIEFAEADLDYPEKADLNNLLEVQPLENLYNEFYKNFENKDYTENRESGDPTGSEILGALQFITTELFFLQNFKNLRKPSGIPETPFKTETPKLLASVTAFSFKPNGEKVTRTEDIFTDNVLFKLDKTPNDIKDTYESFWEGKVTVTKVVMNGEEVVFVKDEIKAPLEKLDGFNISKNITSKTTKAFYENNKYKLDKIDSNISIKFIQALEFLSQYEDSGQDIYTQKNKTIADDLILRIKNLNQKS